MSSKDPRICLLLDLDHISIPIPALQIEWIAFYEVSGWKRLRLILRQLRVGCVLSYATDARDACDSWYNDASILMFLLLAWEEQLRKNLSFESDSDHLDWLEQSEGWDLSGTHPLCFDGVLQTYSYHQHAMLPISQACHKTEAAAR